MINENTAFENYYSQSNIHGGYASKRDFVAGWQAAKQSMIGNPEFPEDVLAKLQAGVANSHEQMTAATYILQTATPIDAYWFCAHLLNEKTREGLSIPQSVCEAFEHLINAYAKQSMQGEPLRINLGDGKHGVHYGTIEQLPCLTISTKGVGEVGKPTTHKNNTEMELESEVMSVTFANHKSYTVFKNIVDSIPIYSDNTHAPDSAARIAELEATIRNMAAVIAKKDEALQIAIEYQEEACQYFHDAMAGYKEHEHQRYRDDLKETKEALALTADGVELVEVGYVKEEKIADWMPNTELSVEYDYDGFNAGDKLYTIKHNIAPDSLKAINPCGGCGETDPQKRCLGCLHNFHAKQPLIESTKLKD